MIEKAIENVVRRVVQEELKNFVPPAAPPGDSAPNDNPTTLSVAEAGELLGVSRNAVYRLVKEQHLRALRIGNRIRVPRWAIDEFVGRERQEQWGACRYCDRASVARYRRSSNEAIAPVDLCAAAACHERLLNDLSMVGALG
jgi:excisionase family DNA binding protein